MDAHRDLPSPDVPSPDVPNPEVVVWEADGTVDGLVGYGEAIARRLEAAGRSVVVVPLPERTPTGAELGAPHHVISGGETAVDDDVGWLAAARAHLGPILEAARHGRASLTGICFGSQLIAHLLAGHGSVGPHPEGMQVGLTALRVPGGRSGGIGSSFHFHRIRREAIADVGGRVVLASTRTEVEAFEVGVAIRGVQFHPELGPDRLLDVVDRHRALIASRGGCADRAARTVDATRHRWDEGPWRRFVDTAPRSASAPDSEPVRIRAPTR